MPDDIAEAPPIATEVDFLDNIDPMKKIPTLVGNEGKLYHQARIHKARMIEDLIMTGKATTPDEVVQKMRQTEQVLIQHRQNKAEQAVAAAFKDRETKWGKELDQALILLAEKSASGFSRLTEEDVKKVKVSEVMNLAENINPQLEAKLTKIYGKLPTRTELVRLPDLSKDMAEGEITESALRYIEDVTRKKVIRKDYQALLPSEPGSVG